MIIFAWQTKTRLYTWRGGRVASDTHGKGEETMTRRTSSVLLVAVFGFFTMGGSIAHAQDATPVIGSTTVLDTPDPSECTVQPMTVDQLRAYQSPANVTPPADVEIETFALPP